MTGYPANAARTIRTFCPGFSTNVPGLRDQWDERHDRHVAWSQRCKQDEVGDVDDPIWIVDAIAEWLDSVPHDVTPTGDNEP